MTNVVALSYEKTRYIGDLMYINGFKKPIDRKIVVSVLVLRGLLISRENIGYRLSIGAKKINMIIDAAGEMPQEWKKDIENLLSEIAGQLLHLNASRCRWSLS